MFDTVPDTVNVVGAAAGCGFGASVGVGATAVVVSVEPLAAASTWLLPVGPDEEPPAVSAATPTAKAATMPSTPTPCIALRRRPSSRARAATAARSFAPGTGGEG